MTTWIITGVLVLLIARIVYLEVVCGRKSKAFLARANEEISALHNNASAAYRAKYGRDPTGTFPLVDDGSKFSSKKP